MNRSTKDSRTRWRPFLPTPQSVAVVAVDRHDLVLVREYRPVIGWDVSQVPMGPIQDEEPFAAARRELAEKTGYVADCWHRVGVLQTCSGWTDQVVQVYLATSLRPVGPDRPRVVRVPLDQFSTLVAAGELQDARTIAAIFAASVGPASCPDCGFHSDDAQR